MNTFTFEITQDHIDKAKKGSIEHCVVNTALKSYNLRVGLYVIWRGEGFSEIFANTTPALQNYIRSWDAHLEVKPQSFTVRKYAPAS